MEIFGDGKVITLEDYRSVGISGGHHAPWRSVTMEKGHLQELEAFALCIQTGTPWPISLAEQLRAMRIAFAVERQLLESRTPRA
jgi:predicted dehydrogenase